MVQLHPPFALSLCRTAIRDGKQAHIGSYVLLKEKVVKEEEEEEEEEEKEEEEEEGDPEHFFL